MGTVEGTVGTNMANRLKAMHRHCVRQSASWHDDSAFDALDALDYARCLFSFFSPPPFSFVFFSPSINLTPLEESTCVAAQPFETRDSELALSEKIPIEIEVFLVDFFFHDAISIPQTESLSLIIPSTPFVLPCPASET